MAGTTTTRKKSPPRKRAKKLTARQIWDKRVDEKIYPKAIRFFEGNAQLRDQEKLEQGLYKAGLGFLDDDITWWHTTGHGRVHNIVKVLLKQPKPTKEKRAAISLFILEMLQVTTLHTDEGWVNNTTLLCDELDAALRRQPTFAPQRFSNRPAPPVRPGSVSVPIENEAHVKLPWGAWGVQVAILVVVMLVFRQIWFRAINIWLFGSIFLVAYVVAAVLIFFYYRQAFIAAQRSSNDTVVVDTPVEPKPSRPRTVIIPIIETGEDAQASPPPPVPVVVIDEGGPPENDATLMSGEQTLQEERDQPDGKEPLGEDHHLGGNQPVGVATQQDANEEPLDTILPPADPASTERDHVPTLNGSEERQREEEIPSGVDAPPVVEVVPLDILPTPQPNVESVQPLPSNNDQVNDEHSLAIPQLDRSNRNGKEKQFDDEDVVGADDKPSDATRDAEDEPRDRDAMVSLNPLPDNANIVAKNKQPDDEEAIHGNEPEDGEELAAENGRLHEEGASNLSAPSASEDAIIGNGQPSAAAQVIDPQPDGEGGSLNNRQLEPALIPLPLPPRSKSILTLTEQQIYHVLKDLFPDYPIFHAQFIHSALPGRELQQLLTREERRLYAKGVVAFAVLNPDFEPYFCVDIVREATNERHLVKATIFGKSATKLLTVVIRNAPTVASYREQIQQQLDELVMLIDVDKA